MKTWKGIGTVALIVLLAFLMSGITVRAQVPWNGPYFGLHVGGASGKGDPTNPATPTLEGKGAFGGAQAGYDFRRGDLVWGGIAEISFGNISGSEPDGNFLSFHAKTDVMGTLRARAGVVWDNAVLTYLSAGLAVSRNEAKMQCTPAIAGVCLLTGPFVATDRKMVAGVAIGAGIEYQMPNSPFRVALEVLHERYPKKVYSFETPGGVVSGGSEQTITKGILRLNWGY